MEIFIQQLGTGVTPAPIPRSDRPWSDRLWSDRLWSDRLMAAAQMIDG